MNEYWEARFQAEGKIWGDAPSRTAAYALELFRKAGVKTILVPGSGYGRNTKLFSSAGFKVTGVEISATAYKTSLEFDPPSKFYNASALDLSFLEDKFDAIYCFNVLHLFREKDRNLFIKECAGRLNAGGLMFFTVFSEKRAPSAKAHRPSQTPSKASRAVRCTISRKATLRRTFNAWKYWKQVSWNTRKTTARKAPTPTASATFMLKYSRS